MTDQALKLMVGLGNPGSQYDKTRHNAGFWLLDEVAKVAGESFKVETKFSGLVCKIQWANRPVWLLKPTTFMNRSGLAVKQIASFYKIDINHILVVHDELDLPAGRMRLKQGGGHGGHNGLRDIHAHMGKEYLRLRVGIDHPGDKNKVMNYVLGEPNKADSENIAIGIDQAVRVMDELVAGDIQAAMNQLHSQT